MRSTLLGYGLLAPSLFGVVCFLLLPMLVVVWLSLHRWDLLGPIRYVGLDNWHSVLDRPGFGNSLLVTLLFIAIVVPLRLLLGLAAAAMLARGLPGTGVFRALYVIPWICSPLAVAVLWRWILAPTDGAVSTVAGQADRVAHRPGTGAAGGLGGHGVDQRGLRGAVLPGRHPGYPPADPRRRAHRRRQRLAAVLAVTLPMLRPTFFFVSVTGSSAPRRCSTPCTRSPAAARPGAPTWWRTASTPRRSGRPRSGARR